MAKMKTSKKKEAWAGSRGARLVGTPLKPSRKASAFYKKALVAAIARMRKDYQRTIERALTPAGKKAAKKAAQDASLASEIFSKLLHLDKKWASVFTRLAAELVGKIIGKVEDASKRNLDESLKDLSGLAIKTPKLPKEALEAVQIATKANVALIKSIHAQYHEKVFMAVMSDVGDAEKIKDVAKRIVSKVYFIGETQDMRAALIARDQTAKLTSAMNIARMKSAGIKKVIWRHSGGSHEPRKLHQSYDGQTFDIDDPPIIDRRTGERGWPGDAINCRCFLVPIMTFGDE